MLQTKSGSSIKPEPFFLHLHHLSRAYFFNYISAKQEKPIVIVMEAVFIEGKSFDKIDFRETNLAKGEYESCSFTACDFSHSNLSEVKFIGCNFMACNLSLAKLKQTSFLDVKFKDCKMLGLRFDHCSEFGLSFSIDNCSLNHSSFYQRKLKKANFKDAQFQEADFTDCDLTAATFHNCDFAGAKFENTNLERADMRTAYNYTLNPAINRIKKAKFSIPQVVGLLSAYDIIIDK